MIINRIYEIQNLLSLLLVSFLVGLKTYQHPCKSKYINILITSTFFVQIKKRTIGDLTLISQISMQ